MSNIHRCEYVDDYGVGCDAEAGESKNCARHASLLREWQTLQKRWCESISWNGMDHPNTIALGKQSGPLAKELGICP